MKIIESIRRLFGRRREIPDIQEDWFIAGGEGVRVCVIDTELAEYLRLLKE